MTVAATNTLNTLGESNDLALRWIPAHCGYKGNELADQIANDSATMVQLPIPRVRAVSAMAYAALRRKTKENWVEFFKQNSPKIFKILWKYGEISLKRS